jgi:hypothetical protein
MLAQAYNEQGKYEEALITLEEGLQYRPVNVESSEGDEAAGLEESVEQLHRELLEKTGKKK